MTASTDEVRFVAADRVATITLNRPDDENRMTPAVLELIALDIELNAQGMGIWLDREAQQQRAPA